jgi:hypothetical protein
MYPTLSRTGALITTLLTLLACSTPNTESDNWETADVVTVAFKLSVYEGGTRSDDDTSSADVAEGPTWGDTYTQENLYYDAAIDPSTVKVYLTDDTGENILTDLTVMSCIKVEGEDNVYTYYGCADKSVFDHTENGSTIRCVVTANTAENTFSLKDLPHDNTQGTQLHIPMWGVGTFTLDKNTRQQASAQIPLLRAAVKCRIKLSEEISKNFSLSDVTLHPAIEKGYVTPGGYDRVKSTEELYFLKDHSENTLYSFHPYIDEVKTTLTQSFLPEPSETEEGSTAWIAYFPEYTNNEDAPIYITLNLSKGTAYTTPHTVAFKNYNNDTLYTELMRNHLYDFTITDVGRSLDVNLKVDNWTTDTMTWDFTEQISDTPISWIHDTYSSINDKEITLLSGVVAEGRFSIQSPVGATWFSTLTSEEYRTFVFVDEEGNELGNTVSGEVSSTGVSRIRIKAMRENNTVQHQATLTFYIEYKDGTTRKVDDLSGWTVIQTI